jgi:hypothetical protein
MFQVVGVGLQTTHRIAWELANGRQVPKGMDVCHTCDNPPCCNPAHLWIGTAKDNTRDMILKGRARYKAMPGEKHGNAKLTDAAVRRIRKMREKGQTLAQIGSFFGVTKHCIWHIVRRNAWKHIK